MSDNPFIEPEDSERTVIRPVPGGRRSAADAPVDVAEPPRPSPAAAVSSEGVETLAMGLSPLVAAAAPLLQLMIRLRNTVNQPDPGDLRERAVQAMRRFEQQSRDTGVPIELLRPAHYALCASLDDVVLNTPWGSTGVWDARSLVSTFHQEVRSGERFFDLLTQMRQNPGRFLPVIELMYLCMSLGFQGRYRLSPRGPAELDRLREETYALILRQRQLAEPELSPHWKGLAAPYRGARPTVPIWVGASVALAILAGLFVWSLLEYGTHRGSFHHAPETEGQVAYGYLVHGVHHAYPDDSRRWVMPLIVTLLDESGAWRVYSLKSPPSEQTGIAENRFSLVGKAPALAGGAIPPVPPEEEVRMLIRDSLLRFNEAIASRSFDAFYDFVARKWQDQLTKGQLQRAEHVLR